MLPFIFVIFIASLAYKVSKDMQLIASSCSLILLFLWIIALACDLTEVKWKPQAQAEVRRSE
jgi:hypothetical protein